VAMTGPCCSERHDTSQDVDATRHARTWRGRERGTRPTERRNGARRRTPVRFRLRLERKLSLSSCFPIECQGSPFRRSWRRGRVQQLGRSSRARSTRGRKRSRLDHFTRRRISRRSVRCSWRPAPASRCCNSLCRYARLPACQVSLGVASHTHTPPLPFSQLPSEAVQRDNMMSLGSTRALGSSRGGMTSGGSGGGFPRRAAKMPLYNSVWPETTPPSFSVWDYCQKKGHAPPPNSLPAPRVTDMKSWFATYGHPTANAPPGVRSEFSATTRSVPFCEGEQSSQVKMHRGRVLR
jgi:hypothetical protein